MCKITRVQTLSLAGIQAQVGCLPGNQAGVDHPSILAFSGHWLGPITDVRLMAIKAADDGLAGGLQSNNPGSNLPDV